jgi:hypothetical protein
MGLATTVLLTAKVFFSVNQRQQASLFRIFDFTFGHRKLQEATFAFGLIRVSPWRTISTETVIAPELKISQVARIVAMAKGYLG